MTWEILQGSVPAVWTQAHLPPAALAEVDHVRDGDVIVAKHTYANYRKMRALGLVVPSPLAHFNWPGSFKPRDVQRRGVEFLLDHDKCVLALPLRAGKTMTCLWGAEFLIQQKAIRRVLVVCPRSIMDNVWHRSAYFNLPHRKATILKGSAKDKQKQAIDRRWEILICNPESLHIIADFLPDVDLVIADENRYRHTNTRIFVSMAAITRTKRLWVATATIAPQSPMDAYGLIRLLRPKYLSMTAWRDMTMFRVSQFRWIPKQDAEQTIAAHLRPTLRVPREECTDLSGVEVAELPFELSKEQTALCDKLKEEAIAELEGATITAANAAIILSKLLQVQSGGVYCHDASGERIAKHIEAGGFYETLEEIVSESDAPVLIFCAFRATVDAIVEHLRKAGHDVEAVVGDTPPAERTRIFDAVQNKSIKAMVAITTVVSHGITLSSANVIVWTSPPFSNEVYQQANGRIINPDGRTSAVIFQMVGSSMARSLFKRLETREALQDAVLGLLEEKT